MLLKKYYERFMLFFGLLVQTIGFIISITIEDFSTTLFPSAEIIVPIINGTGILVSIFMLIFPRFKLFQSISFFTFCLKSFIL